MCQSNVLFCLFQPPPIILNYSDQLPYYYNLTLDIKDMFLLSIKHIYEFI